MDEKDLVKDRNNISDIVREYLELKPAGAGSFKAICPFHHEKSPSLHISDEKQIWHCFGCGKGGDVISFVMEMQGIDFRDALEQLARKAGITLTQGAPQGGEQKKVTFALNEQACAFFETVLHEHELGSSARTYLKQRDFDSELSKKFRLGFAPKSWDALIKMFGTHGTGVAQLVTAGLAKKGNKGDVIDLFRERIVIPIRDIQGRVAGFTARAITADTLGPKYLNSPETDVFKKRAVLYGLYEARTAIRLENKAIIAEGNLDVIASHKAGIEYIVASSGTALTEEHIVMLKRLTQNLLFCFDADAAGFRAAQKGIHLAQQHDMHVQVIRIPRELGKDPDDVVRGNPEAWRTIVQKPIHIMQFYIEEFARLFKLETPEGKSSFVQAVASEIARSSDPVERTYWTQRAADTAHVSIENVDTSVRTLTEPKKLVIPEKKTLIIAKKLGRPELLFWEAICMISEHGLDLQSELKEEDVPGDLRELYRNIRDLYDIAVTSADPQTFKQQLLTKFITPEASQLRALLLQIEEAHTASEHNARVEIQRHVTSLKLLARGEHKQRLEADIRIAEQENKQERLQALLQEYQTLI